MMLRFDVAAGNWVGKRPYQEDASAILYQGMGRAAAVLADGMGGHGGGALASATVVRAFHDAATASPAFSLAVMEAAMHDAVERLKTLTDHPDGAPGMGSTLLAVSLEDTALSWLSVGDSPLFLFRENRLVRLNADHSYTPVLEEQVRRGMMTAGQAAADPRRHGLRSSVAAHGVSLAETRTHPDPLQAGDIVLLASDGLFTLGHSSLLEVLQAPGGQAAATLADRLLDAVRQIGKEHQDNATVVVVRCSG